jgi:dienelactone hydrolase
MTLATRLRAAAAAVVLALASAPLASAQVSRQDVTFATLAQDHVILAARLTLPAGPGPFPAMVLLHACEGLVGNHVADWAAWFAANGYAALVVDSFGPRHVRSTCGGGQPGPRPRALDALGALAYLRTRSEIDGARIGVIGWSAGAWGAYFANDADLVRTVRAGGNAFEAVIALYPPCVGTSSITTLTAPMLFLLGEKDDWTPAADCLIDAQRLATGAVPLTVHVYPGATHAFDNPASRGVVHVGTHAYTLAYDAGAAADARKRVLAFLSDVMAK